MKDPTIQSSSLHGNLDIFHRVLRLADYRAPLSLGSPLVAPSDWLRRPKVHFGAHSPK